jgi:hypothetical protein
MVFAGHDPVKTYYDIALELYQKFSHVNGRKAYRLEGCLS